MKLKEVVFAFILSFSIAGIFTFPLFSTVGQETTFDGPTHMQTIAQFTEGLRDGQFPVRWGAGFARHGMPIPLVAQQTTSYLGAFINLFVDDVMLSYRLVVFIGAFISVLLMYVFVRLHVDWLSATFAAFLFHVAPYRIANVYIRGALPEFFASIPVLVVLIGLYVSSVREEQRHRMWGLVLVCVGVAGIILTHPFMIIISAPLVLAYGGYRLFSHPKPRHVLVAWAAAAGLGGMLSAYYLIPLSIEIRYFHYASAVSHFVDNNFLSPARFFIETWSFFGPDVATRGNILQGGFFEGLVLLVGVGVAVYLGVHKKRSSLFVWFTVCAGVYALSMLAVTRPLYQHTFMDGIQHPWRMLSGFILVVPILAGLLIQQIPARWRLAIVIVGIGLIGWVRFPQLYTKNARLVSPESYYVTDENTHGLIMNTVWMGDARTYPYQETKGSVIGGEGSIMPVSASGIRRVYKTSSDESLRILDYTFYFPGWKAYVDGKPVPIQFQDPSYRGLLTFDVPAGDHIIEVVFEKTKIRLLAELISLGGLVLLVVMLWRGQRLLSK